jgi:glycosyltransferase involved in cell wall biosynthesis
VTLTPTKPRILVVSGDHGVPAFGRKGSSAHLRGVISGLRAEGAEVVLASANVEGDRREDEMFPVVRLPRPTSRYIGMDGRCVLSDYLANSTLRNVVMRARPQFIYERSSLYFHAGDRIARSFQLPRILEVNTLLAEELSTRLKLPGWAALSELKLLKSSRAIAAISEVMRERLIGEVQTRADIRVFSMAVDPQVFRNRGRRAIVRSRLNIAPDTPFIGYIGSMNHYHRPGRFVTLIQDLIERHSGPIAFAMIGGTHLKCERFEDRLASIPEHFPVHFPGTVPQAELSDWVEALDLVVIPGAAPQSTPTKLFEVAAVGTPVIAPRIRPLEAIVPEAASMLLFGEENYEELLQLVESWLHDRTLLKDATAMLQKEILEKYTWRQQARRLLSWFEELQTATAQEADLAAT